MEHSQWKGSGNRQCGSMELRSDQEGLTGRIKTTGVYPENIRESLKGSKTGEEQWNEPGMRGPGAWYQHLRSMPG